MVTNRIDDYELFCEHMKRYEAGERELNQKEKDWAEELSRINGVPTPLPFDEFLEHMKRYEEEVSLQNQMHM